jgi:hypothetical protein
MFFGTQRQKDTKSLSPKANIAQQISRSNYREAITAEGNYREAIIAKGKISRSKYRKAIFNE